MNRLPPELLLMIGDHIQTSSDSQITLHSLSLCCRHFHDVFQPMLYHSMSLCFFSVKYAHLIVRLWRHPEIASQVRRLKMSCELVSDYQESVDQLSGDVEIRSFIQKALDEIFTPDEEYYRSFWEKDFHHKHNCAQAWLGLLLVRTNHLQTIEFGYEYSETMSDILHKAANRTYPFHEAPPFPYLEEVRGCSHSWIGSGFFTPFFYFPAVRTIYGSLMVECPDSQNILLDKNYNSSSVREIIVDEAYWCRGMLDWLALCTKLEHVSIKVHFETHQDKIFDSDKFDASLFRMLLLPSATTLKTLRICYGQCYRHQLEEQDVDDVPFGTFRDFVAMQDVTVQHSHLIGCPSHDSTVQPPAEILPRSLKRIEITEVIESHQLQLLLQLSELVERNCCPNLEAVVLHLDLENEYVPIDALDRLELECEARGVDLKFPEHYYCYF